jgi:hypothetical protein
MNPGLGRPGRSGGPQARPQAANLNAARRGRGVSLSLSHHQTLDRASLSEPRFSEEAPPARDSGLMPVIVGRAGPSVTVRVCGADSAMGLLHTITHTKYARATGSLLGLSR